MIVTYRAQEEFDALVQAAAANGSRLEGERVDVTDETEVRRLIEGVLAQHHRLDALVNTVGGYAGGSMWDVDAGVLDRMLALNLRSGYALSRVAMPPMLKQGQGSIVNVAAKAAFDHPAGAAAYAASKAAVLAMMGSLAAEVTDARRSSEFDRSEHYRHSG